jgi:hypothetical protein
LYSSKAYCTSCCNSGSNKVSPPTPCIPIS